MGCIRSGDDRLLGKALALSLARAVRLSVWLSRRAYEDLVKRQDDRDMKTLRDGHEVICDAIARLERSVLSLRTYVQRRMDRLGLEPDDDVEPSDGGNARMDNRPPGDAGWYARPSTPAGLEGA